MAVILDAAVRKLQRPPDQAALLSALVVHEQHASSFGSIRTCVLFLAVPCARKVGSVRDGQADGAIRLDDIDAPNRDDAECRIASYGYTPQHGHGKSDR